MVSKYLVFTHDAPYTQGLDRKCDGMVRLGIVIHKGNGCFDGHGEALHVVVAMLKCPRGDVQWSTWCRAEGSKGGHGSMTMES